MGSEGTIEELLQREDAWIRIIEITRDLWKIKLPDATILKYLNDYEQLQER